MAELKLPFSFTPGQEVPADQLQADLDTMRQLVQDLNDRVEAFENLQVSGIFDNTDKLITDIDENVNTPGQPACKVKSTLFSGYQTIDNSNEIITIGDEFYDVAGDFDDTTYTFTAPVDGIYLFIAQIPLIGLGAGYGEARVQLMVNGSTENYTGINEAILGVSAGVINIPIVSSPLLDAGDAVTLTGHRLAGAGSFGVGAGTLFWGRLIG